MRLVQPATVETVQGIVKTLKDSFGFIERADVEKDVSSYLSLNFFRYCSLYFTVCAVCKVLMHVCISVCVCVCAHMTRTSYCILKCVLTNENNFAFIHFRDVLYLSFLHNSYTLFFSAFLKLHTLVLLCLLISTGLLIPPSLYYPPPPPDILPLQ